jgi:hypothetical protein
VYGIYLNEIIKEIGQLRIAAWLAISIRLGVAYWSFLMRSGTCDSLLVVQGVRKGSSGAKKR